MVRFQPAYLFCPTWPSPSRGLGATGRIASGRKIRLDGVRKKLDGGGEALGGSFLQMCSHHLVEPVAWTPASGWEKGQVENHVGLVRDDHGCAGARNTCLDLLLRGALKALRCLKN